MLLAPVALSGGTAAEWMSSPSTPIFSLHPPSPALPSAPQITLCFFSDHTTLFPREYLCFCTIDIGWLSRLTPSTDPPRSPSPPWPVRPLLSAAHLGSCPR